MDSHTSSSFPSEGNSNSVSLPGYELIRKQDGTYDCRFAYNVCNSRAMKPCGKPCASCKFVSNNQYVRSNMTGTALKPNISITGVNCHTKNVIYCVTCAKCQLQYVGETTRSVHQRFSEHRYSVKKGNSYLATHFRQCGVNCMKITVLETVRTEDRLKDREDFWIRLLNSAFPFGLNDKIIGYGNVSDVHLINNKINHQPYLSKPVPRKKRSHGKRRRTSKRTPGNVFTELDNEFDGVDYRKLYVKLKALNKKELRKLKQDLCYYNSSTHTNVILIHSLNCFLLSLKSKQKVSHNHLPKEYIKFDFPNKGTEMIKIHNVLKDRSLIRLLPSQCKNKNFLPYFQYEKPLSFCLYNYSKVLKDLTLSNLKNVLNDTCKCLESSYLYLPHNHIMTGSTNFLQCKIARKIFSKGAKFREPKNLDFQQVKQYAISNIKHFIDKKVHQHNLNQENFTPFLNRAIEIISNRISYFNRTLTHHRNNYELPNQFWSYIDLLHRNFVVVPTDKATNNYAFICKKFYIQTIANELGVSYDRLSNNWKYNGNITYSVSAKDESSIFNAHEKISKQFNLTLDIENKKTPSIFATAKMHKNPYAFRFITGARKSSTKPLSILAHFALKHIKAHLKAYCNVSESREKFNKFWSIDNNIDVISKLSKLKTNNVDGSSLISVDFSNLFTSLPHHTITTCLFALFDLLFNNANKQYIAISTYKQNSFYSNEKSYSSYNYLNINDLKFLINALITESYVKFCGLIFHQKCGIPQGGNACPMIADLTLTAMEFLFLRSSTNLQRSRIISNAFRYIDDLLIVAKPEAEELLKEIYSSELTINRTNTLYDKCDFLDLTIKRSAKFTFSIYNKTDDYNFKVIRFIFRDSNVCSDMGYKVFQSQVIRYARIISCKQEFFEKTLDMMHLLMNHGFSKAKLIKTFLKCAKSYPLLFCKYSIFDDNNLMCEVVKNFCVSS